MTFLYDSGVGALKAGQGHVQSNLALECTAVERAGLLLL